MSNEERLQQIHPVLASRVRDFLAKLQTEGINVLITQGLRTWEEQDALYAKGRTTPGPKVTNAQGGHSQHNFGLAVDVAPEDAGVIDWNLSHPNWKRILELAPQFKLAEGAQWRTFPDNPHLYPVEIPATCEVLREKYSEGGVENVWKWFDSLVSTPN